MAKIYAVKKGFKTGIFNSWPECQEAVKGFSGAVYKGFLDTEMDKALAFIGVSNEGEGISKEDTATAYVDGSYNPDTKEYGCGVILSYRDKVIEISKKDSDENLREMRNVAGELMGTMAAINSAIGMNAKKIEINYDYEGIEHWATGYWRTNKIGTQSYKKFIEEAKKNIVITFNKVKAHAGVSMNERADVLAKNALGLASTEVKKMPDIPENLRYLDGIYPNIFEFMDSYIKSNNDYEEFELIDKFFEDNPSYNGDNDGDIIDLFSFVYEKNVMQGNIQIF